MVVDSKGPRATLDGPRLTYRVILRLELRRLVGPIIRDEHLAEGGGVGGQECLASWLEPSGYTFGARRLCPRAEPMNYEQVARLPGGRTLYIDRQCILDGLTPRFLYYILPPFSWHRED